MTSDPHLSASARSAVGFAAGALLPLAAWLLLLPALGALGFYRGGTMLRPLAVLVIACAAGGVVAGSALGGGARWRAGFAAAFGATLWFPFLMLSSLQALGGRESLVELVVGFAPGLAAAHAVLGAFGLALGGMGRRSAGRGALVFGAAGGCGGVLLALVIRLSAGSGGAAAFAAGALGGGAACLLPLTLAGWWLGRSSSGPRHSTIDGVGRAGG